MAQFLHGRRGVYTTMRSVGGTSVFSLQEHVRRLAQVRSAVEPDGHHPGFDEEATGQMLLPRLREAVARFIAEGGAGSEMRISAAVRLRDESKAVAAATLEDMEVMVAVEKMGEQKVRRE